LRRRGFNKEKKRIFMGIERLPREVVERIAAGEVITSPCAAVKELLENAIDSGGDSLLLEITQSVLDEIIVEDNGCGIPREDFDLVCCRFATSKLKRYEDLSGIGTFGFRGEALSSISLCGEVSLSSARKDGDGWRGVYEGTDLKGVERAVVRKGTRVTVKNLFRKDPEKESKFWKRRGEVKRISALALNHSICHNTIEITLRIKGPQIVEIRTGKREKREVVEMAYGKTLARELLEISANYPGLSYTGLVTHSTYSLGSPKIILFVNGRMVEWEKMKRRISGIYKEVLMKGQHPFVYLEMEIPGEGVDVNVHPSKKEVYVREEERILGRVVDHLEETLGQMRVTGMQEKRVKGIIPFEGAESGQREKSRVSQSQGASPSQRSVPVAANKRVRVEKGLQPLELFSMPEKLRRERAGGSLSSSSSAAHSTDKRESAVEKDFPIKGPFEIEQETPKDAQVDRKVREEFCSRSGDSEYIEFRAMVFVGMASQDTLFVQVEEKLVSFEWLSLLHHFFSCEISRSLGSFLVCSGNEQVDPPVFRKWRMGEQGRYVAGRLRELFQIDVSEDSVVLSTPIVSVLEIREWSPFLLSLVGRKDGEIEYIQELASFVLSRASGKEHLLFAEMSSRGCPVERGRVREVTCISSLYKHFERC
jgi:DNA mismatch repair protein MLH1